MLVWGIKCRKKYDFQAEKQAKRSGSGKEKYRETRIPYMPLPSRCQHCAAVPGPSPSELGSIQP